MSESKIEMKLEEELKPFKELCDKITKMLTHDLEGDMQGQNVMVVGQTVDMIKDLCEAEEKIAKCCYYKTILGAMEREEEKEKEEEKMWMQHMKEHEGEEDYEDEDRRFYRGQPRSRTTGRYMRRGDGRRSNRGRSRRYDDDWSDYEQMNDPWMMYNIMHDRMHYNEQSNYGGNGTSSTNTQSNYGGSNANQQHNYDNAYQQGMQEGDVRGYRRGYSQGQQEANSNYSSIEQARRNYDTSRRNHEDNAGKAKQLDKLLTEVETYLDKNKGEMSMEERNVMQQKMQKMTQNLSS